MSIYVAQWRKWEEILPIAKEYNLGIEIQEFCNPDSFDDCDRIIETTNRQISGIQRRSFHGPFQELIPASRDSEIRRVTRSRFANAYEVAGRLEAEHLILHSGFIPKTYPPKEWLNNSIKFWNDFLADKQESIEIHIENIYENDHFMISELIDAIGNPYFTACLDIGHVNANSTNTFDNWIKGLNDRIRYVHLHNNDGTYDDHYGFGRGKMNIIQILELLKTYAPKAKWSIETADIEPSVEWLKTEGFL